MGCLVIADKLRLLRIQSSTVFDNIRAVGSPDSETQPTYCYNCFSISWEQPTGYCI